MVSAIIRDLDPDYIDIGSEPDTEAALTGLSELNDPLRYTEYVRYVLTGFVPGGKPGLLPESARGETWLLQRAWPDSPA